MEEVILSSRLPTNQLWLRVQCVRESCHCRTSVTLDKVDFNLIGDAKRLVSSNEIADFINHLVSLDSNFRMMVYFILALKVPLLPTRNCTLRDLAKEELSWTAESKDSGKIFQRIFAPDDVFVYRRSRGSIWNQVL